MEGETDMEHELNPTRKKETEKENLILGMWMTITPAS